MNVAVAIFLFGFGAGFIVAGIVLWCWDAYCVRQLRLKYRENME